MASKNSTDEEKIRDRIEKAESCLKTHNPTCINGPVYASK